MPETSNTSPESEPLADILKEFLELVLVSAKERNLEKCLAGLGISEEQLEKFYKIIELSLIHGLPPLSLVDGKTVAAMAKVLLSECFRKGMEGATGKCLAKPLGKELLKSCERVAARQANKGVSEVTKTSVSNATHISQASAKAAAKAGATAAGISAVVGGVFLYHDLKNLDEKKEDGSINAEEYKEQKGERIGEYAGNVIGSGVVGVALSMAALTGPVGWAAIGFGALFSYGIGKLGGVIGKKLA